MKISDWISKGIQVQLSIKRELVFLLALFLFNCFSFSSWTQLGQVATKPWLLLAWFYGLVTLLPLVWRYRAPAAVFVAQCVLTLAAWPIMPYYTPVVGILVALYAVSAYCNRKFSLFALLLSLISAGLSATAAVSAYHIQSERIDSFIQNAVLLVLATGGVWTWGRLSLASQRSLEYRFQERRQEEIQEAVLNERKRIALELHDSVSYALNVMALEAAGAIKVGDTDRAAVEQLLNSILATSKQTMIELRRLLLVLTSSSADSNESGSQPGLANLAELLASFRATGNVITDHVEGVPRKLTPSVDLVAYRIVQEGLTNVLKHAGKDPNPQLWLKWGADSLYIQVDNGIDLAADSVEPPYPGTGLRGMRQRVRDVGGQVHAGPQRGAGFRLTATLPFTTSIIYPGISSTTAPRASNQGVRD